MNHPSHFSQQNPSSNQRLNVYPFSDDDLAALLWARDHHRPAHDAIVEAENRATDEPGRRPKANTYIHDCLANIRRKMEEVETASVIAFGFRLQDRLVEVYGPGVLSPGSGAKDAADAADGPLAGKVAGKVRRRETAAGVSEGGGLWG